LRSAILYKQNRIQNKNILDFILVFIIMKLPKLTYKELAEKLWVHYQTVIGWIQWYNKPRDYEKINKIYREFKEEIDLFLKDIEEKQSLKEIKLKKTWNL